MKKIDFKKTFDKATHDRPTKVGISKITRKTTTTIQNWYKGLTTINRTDSRVLEEYFNSIGIEPEYLEDEMVCDGCGEVYKGEDVKLEKCFICGDKLV